MLRVHRTSPANDKDVQECRAPHGNRRSCSNNTPQALPSRPKRSVPGIMIDRAVASNVKYSQGVQLPGRSCYRSCTDHRTETIPADLRRDPIHTIPELVINRPVAADVQDVQTARTPGGSVTAAAW